MNSQHRTKGFASVFISLTFACTLAPSHAFAQQRGRSGQPRTSTPSARQTDEKAAARRAQAINLLIETANQARTFNDMAYRARIQALAADALWPFDETRARQIFRRAWDAAAAADRAEQRTAEEETGVFSNSDEVSVTAERDEVLSKAAARDEKLAETFMREMIEEKDRASESAKGNKSTRRTPWRELSPLGARRLALAYELLNKGDDIWAVRVAEPLINEGVTGELVEFIFRLSLPIVLDPDGGSYSVSSFASTLYQKLAAKAAADPHADANDVLLLSSFIISPDLLMVVDERGSLQFRSIPSGTIRTNPPEPDSESFTYKPFYDLAVRVLLQRGTVSQRPLNPVQDRIARYVATGRVLPLFEQAGPRYAQFVPVMRSQLAKLSSEIEASRRDALNAQFELTSLSRRNLSDLLAPQLEQLTRAGDKQERDRISLAIVRRAAHERLWDRAQRAAYSIEDGDMRRAALSFIVVNQIADIQRAYKDDREDDFESVARFVRRSDAPPFASAWGLAQAAVVAKRKGSRAEVSALLSEAESYAARADKDSRQRIAAYIVITDAAARVDTERAWDIFAELVRAVNSTADYMGDETTLQTSADITFGSELQDELSIESAAFRLDRIFATMARIDFDKSLTQAQALTGEIPRAYARIAAARAALEKK
ncbi:MAG TPA: hypothetical protein VGC66_19540 [Pyrinomonadaceae bacterium]|jgi:hypothetical protein